MALVDNTVDKTDLNQLVEDVRDAAGQNQPANPEGQATDNQNTECPAWIDQKFWTGNVEESAAKQHEAYLNLQSAHGRMANELGVQRKLTDQILQQQPQAAQPQPAPAPAPELPKLTGAALLDNPTEALEAYLKSRDAQRDSDTQRRIDELEAELKRERFVARHPDLNDIAQSPEFVNWANATPMRQRLVANAQQGDFDSAAYLLDEYKSTVMASQQAEPSPRYTQQTTPIANQAAPTSLSEQAKAASLETSGTNSSGKKTYSRTALMQLRTQQPEVYSDPAFQAEIMKAYSEGRVK